MADLLTHVLVTWVVLTVASWRIDAIESRWIAVAMGGSAIPDLVKIGIVLDPETVGRALGAPFSYAAISSVGGVAVIATGIAVVFRRDDWRRAYGYLLLGGVSALLVDGMRVFADGRAGRWLFPLTWWRPPTPSLYVTSDPRVTAVALAVAALVAGWDRARRRRVESE